MMKGRNQRLGPEAASNQTQTTVATKSNVGTSTIDYLVLVG